MRPGFTLLELLVTMGIIGIIAAFGVPAYSQMQQNSALNGATQELASAIRVAQNRALTSQQGADHGIAFSANGLSYTEYHVIPPSAPVSGTAHNISSTPITTGAGSSILFHRLTGLTDSAADVIIDGQKKIAVTPAGKITITTP